MPRLVIQALKSPFAYCPACRAQGIAFTQKKLLHCGDCGFHYYHNVATAVGAILRYQGDILLAVRAQQPASGMLDLPGGFSEPGESLEQALRRELAEELDLIIDNPRYLFSFPNTYPYRGVTYHTTDAFFEVEFATRPVMRAADDVAATRWLNVQNIPLQEIAFESVRKAVRRIQGIESANHQ